MPLQIGDHKINSITGPIALHLLVPDEKRYFQLQEKGINMPIFMLFGDQHYSTTGYCDNCSCSSKEQHCCYKIWEKDFLKIIDSVSSDDYPTDFYIEGFFNNISGTALEYIIKSPDSDPMTKLREELITCYDRNLRGTGIYKYRCPTENVRWQFADTRQRTGKLSSEAGTDAIQKLFTNVFNIKNDIATTIFTMFNDFNFSKDKNEANFLEGFDYDFFYSCLENYFQLMMTPKEFVEKHISLDSPWFKQSLIYKEISKQNGFDAKTWIDIIKKHAIGQINEAPFLPNKSQVNQIKKVQKMILDKLPKKNSIKNYDAKVKLPGSLTMLFQDIKTKNMMGDENVSQFMMANMAFTTYGLWFLDAYLLARSFKMPKDSKNPFLSIAYLGAGHSKSIADTLIKGLGYKLVYSKENNKANVKHYRCLELDKHVNLNEIALRYNNYSLFSKTEITNMTNAVLDRDVRYFVEQELTRRINSDINDTQLYKTLLDKSREISSNLPVLSPKKIVPKIETIEQKKPEPVIIKKYTKPGLLEFIREQNKQIRQKTGLDPLQPKYAKTTSYKDSKRTRSNCIPEIPYGPYQWINDSETGKGYCREYSRIGGNRRK